MKCLPVRIDRDEVVRIDVFAQHFHASRAEVLRAIVRLGIASLFEEYRNAPNIDVLAKHGRLAPGGAPPKGQEEAA